MAKYKESHARSILKAVCYRLCAAIVTTTIVFVFTRKVVLSLSVGLVEAIVKIIFYYLHERAWSFIGFGKQAHPLSSLPVERSLTEKDMDEVKRKLVDLGYISED